MPENVRHYTPQVTLELMRRQARKVWGVGLAVAAFWAGLMILAPVLADTGSQSASSVIYRFFSYLCHQIPERSFSFHGHPFAVCSRCFGVYFGLFFGFVVYPFFRNLEEIEPFSRIWLFLAMIPIGVDWSLGIFGFWENTHLSRFVTGAILGAACGIFIVPAIVEIGRNLSGRRNRRKLP